MQVKAMRMMAGFAAVFAMVCGLIGASPASSTAPLTDQARFDAVRLDSSRQAARRGADQPTAPPTADLSLAARIARQTRREAGDRSGRALIAPDADFSLRDVQTDSSYDLPHSPELAGAGLGVPRDNPTTALFVGATDVYTFSSMSYYGFVGLALDVTGDGSMDYATITPSAYMTLDQAYSAPVYRFVGDTPVSTGHAAYWMRVDTAYGVLIDWSALGLSVIRYYVALENDYGEDDYAPDHYSQPIDLRPAPAPANQGQFAIPRTLKVRKSFAIGGATNAGMATWVASSNGNVCRVSRAGSGWRVTGKRKGGCLVTVTAPGNASWNPLHQTRNIRVK